MATRKTTPQTRKPAAPAKTAATAKPPKASAIAKPAPVPTNPRNSNFETAPNSGSKSKPATQDVETKPQAAPTRIERAKASLTALRKQLQSAAKSTDHTGIASEHDSKLDATLARLAAEYARVLGKGEGL